ncbi:TRAP transporter substrate-binding protein [Schlegelella sp. S2-27]|uniref:TRAP transporter substrate-binding protein n=1 Tax=Caldimonas mangrovi TaxID=2944811 RepID=A0ABT0YLR1_9BURK|nr:TRAP transporter substrate-binding protein [Caldimonas mangrovi]MCM5679309.1 TRAP transporter substrate-binding protein [Caldimonas mangrovi]
MKLTRRRALSTLGGWGLLPLHAWALAQRHQLSGAYGEAVFHTQNLQTFVRQIADRTSGGLEIEVVPNSKLKPMAEVIPALERKEIAFGEVLMSAYGAQHPVLGMDALPFIVRGFEDAARMWDVTRPTVRDYLAARGVRLLYAVPWPPQGLYSRMPVNKLADLKGLKFRVYNAATQRLAELSGAQPVTIAANNLQKAIEEGGVDAMLTSSTTGVDSQAWKAMKVFVDMRAWIPKNMLCMSEAVWTGLDDAGRQAIVQASTQAEANGWRLAREADDSAKKTLTDHKMEVNLPSVDLRRTLDLLGERFGREWVGKAGMGHAGALVDYYTKRNR